MKFRTAYSEKDRDFSIGDFPVTLPEYRMEFNQDTGSEELVPVGHVNFVAKIQEAAKDCNIYNQIDRYNRSGDASFLGETVDGFIDTLSMPRSLMDVENIRSKSRQLWNVAPLEIRSKYGNDISRFMKDVDAKLKQRSISKLEKQRSAVKGEVTNE